MAAYAADGSRVERLLARLRRTEETHRSALDAIEEARRTGRMSKWNAQLATNYHSGLHEGTRSARLVVQEGLDESLTTTLSGRPQVVYGTGALLSRMIDAAAERDMEVSELLSALTCEHELVEVELLNGTVLRSCEHCDLDPDTLNALGVYYDAQLPCRICGGRGGNGMRTDREGDLVPCYECTSGEGAA